MKRDGRNISSCALGTTVSGAVSFGSAARDATPAGVTGSGGMCTGRRGSLRLGARSCRSWRAGEGLAASAGGIRERRRSLLTAQDPSGQARSPRDRAERRSGPIPTGARFVLPMFLIRASHLALTPGSLWAKSPGATCAARRADPRHLGLREPAAEQCRCGGFAGRAPARISPAGTPRYATVVGCASAIATVLSARPCAARLKSRRITSCWSPAR
jgi:hypothetical protein